MTLMRFQPSKPFMTPRLSPIQWLDATIHSVSGYQNLKVFFIGVVASVAVLIPLLSEAAENDRGGEACDVPKSNPYPERCRLV